MRQRRLRDVAKEVALIVVAALFFGLWHQSLDAGMALFGVLMFLEIRLP